MRKWTILALVLVVGAAGFWIARERRRDAPPPPPDHVPVRADTFALLVGCTEYPNLREVRDPEVYDSTIRLLGPANDAALMHSVLRSYLGVPEANVRVLAGWPDDPEARPTRANVLGHLDRLAGEVTDGSHVIFLFAGHGDQQPDAEEGDEADGVDEILLPADTGRWDPEICAVANVITDDEIQDRLLALRDAGATVWAIFDCCHSGTMMRGEGSDDDPEGFEDVRMRTLPPGLLGIPAEAGTRSARGLETRSEDEGILRTRGRSLEGVAAIYAARSWEKAAEMVLPRRRLAVGRESHGLCTFQVARALQLHGGNLTIAEIFEHVRASYTALPWSEATPVAEGDLSLRALPGAGDGGPALLLRRDGDLLVLDAGSLRGLTVGSVLEVYRPGRFRDPSGRLGRVGLATVEPLRSVCGPVPGGPDPASVPGGAPTEVVELAAGGLRVRLSLLDVSGAPVSDAAGKRLLEQLLGADATLHAAFPVEGPAQADWHVRPLPPTDTAGTAPRFVLLPKKAGPDLAPIEVAREEVLPALRHVRRAESWRRWARSHPLSEFPEGLVVDARFRRLGAHEPGPLEAGVDLRPGDQILLSIANRTDLDVDVAIKNLDWAQHEHQVWPGVGEPSGRLTRYDEDVDALLELELTAEGFGRESLLLVLATRGSGAAPLDVGELSGTAAPLDEILAERQGERALRDAIAPGVVRARGGTEAPPDSVAVMEIAWRSTWGTVGVPDSLRSRLDALEAPARGAPSAEGRAPPSGWDTTWHRAALLPGDARTADVLLLAGAAANGPFAVLVDEDGDARLGELSLIEAAGRAAARELPVEVSVFFGEGGTWAAYPRASGDVALGSVRVRAGATDQAERQFELDETGWRDRATYGPWLSPAFVPESGGDPGLRHSRIVRALRRAFGDS